MEFGLDGCPRDVDRENVLDLITVIEDERRFHAAAAVMVAAWSVGILQLLGVRF